MNEDARGDLYDRMVCELLRIAVGAPTAAEADATLELIRARLLEKLDQERNPDAAAVLRRLLGRLIDAMKGGGRRA